MARSHKQVPSAPNYDRKEIRERRPNNQKRIDPRDYLEEEVESQVPNEN